MFDWSTAREFGLLCHYIVYFGPIGVRNVPNAGRRTDFRDKKSTDFAGEIFLERFFWREITARTTLFPVIGCGEAPSSDCVFFFSTKRKF